jgi:hypothetical protein
MSPSEEGFNTLTLIRSHSLRCGLLLCRYSVAAEDKFKLPIPSENYFVIFFNRTVTKQMSAAFI